VDSYLVYGSYVAAAIGALAVYFALPRGKRPVRGASVVLGAAALGSLVWLLHALIGESIAVSFVVLSLIVVASAARVVTHSKPVYSALYFVLVVIGTAGMAVTAGAEFLAAGLIIVYAGAILVTYVFVIMLAQQPGNLEGSRYGGALNYDTVAREPVAAVLAGFVLTATLAGVIVGRPMKAVAETTAADAENTLAIGRLMLSDFSVSVELAGVLLMVAMVGAIALSRRRVVSEVDGDVEGPAPGESGRRAKPF